VLGQLAGIFVGLLGEIDGSLQGETGNHQRPRPRN
jgi:hypothetical protein